MRAYTRRKICDRHVRYCSLEQLGPLKDRMQSDEPAVTPADDPQPVEICVRNEIAQIRSRCENIADFLAAVIDRVVEILPVTRTSAVFGSDDHVAFADKRANVGDVRVT